MEHCAGGSISDVMHVTGSGLAEQLIKYIAGETLTGLAYLHSVGKVRGRRECRRGTEAGNSPHQPFPAPFLDGSHSRTVHALCSLARCNSHVAGAQGHQVRKHSAHGERRGQASRFWGGCTADQHHEQAQHLHWNPALDGTGGDPNEPLRRQGARAARGARSTPRHATCAARAAWERASCLPGVGFRPGLLRMGPAQVDIWALGITVMEMAEQMPPRWNINPNRVIFMIVKDPSPKLGDTDRWSLTFQDFIAQCLQKARRVPGPPCQGALRMQGFRGDAAVPCPPTVR